MTIRQLEREKFDSMWMPEPNSGCWLWLSYCTSHGYGRFAFDGAEKYAHRTAWEIYRGPIPSGMVLCHKCDNPGCCNPDHLFVGSMLDNMRDMARKGRSARGEKQSAAKLNADLVRFIRSDSRNQYTLAKEIGVDQSQISRVRSRKLWGHII